VEDDEIATSLLHISSTLNMLGRFDEGRPYAEQALELQEAALGPRHPRVAASLMNLGGFAMMEKKRAEALERYERALSIVQEQAPDDPGASFGLLLNISSLHRHEGHPQQAADTLRLFLDIVERAPNPEAVDPSRVAWVHGEIAMLERRYEDALVQYERAALGEEVQRYEETRGLLGVAMALYHLGRLEESVSVHRRVLGLLEPRPGTVPDIIDINDRVATLQSLAQTLAALGDHEAALQELRLARELVVALPDPAESAVIDAELGAQLDALGRSNEALPSLREAVRTLETASVVDPESVVEGLVALGEAELATGDQSAAREHAERAVSRVEGHEGEPLPSAARAWFLLARSLGTSSDERARARSLARRAQEQWATEGMRSRRDLERVQAWLAAER
jgi:tetratricopeptide (TPR) repeat protein